MARERICSYPDGSCLAPTSDPSRRCPDHRERTGFAAGFRRTPSSPTHRSYAWRKLSREFLASWRADHGAICAGFRVDPHPSPDLASDHIVPVSLDPSLALDPSNLQALCPSCNARKSLSQRDRMGGAQT